MSLANSQLSSKSKTSSVYQTDGKPLSPEALYKAKLKYGIYNNPTTNSIGVPSSNGASDTAALLATNSDLSIEPYKREIATDAQTAALFARQDTAPKRWTKNSVDLEATSAAISAKSLKHELARQSPDTSNSNAAAASVLSKGSKSIASSNLASLYEFDAVRNGTKNSNASLNINKLSSVSKQRANTLINDRINPERDASRLGLNTTKDSSNLEKFAAVGALASQNKPKVEDPNFEAKAIYKNSLVDPKVLAQARLNADRTLTGIDKNLGEVDLFLNPEFNAKAIELAKQKYETRSTTTGKVDLGGGLFMSQEELDAIASKIVNPVLEDINKKAKSQRDRDAELNKKKNEQIAAERRFKIEQQSKKQDEKRIKNEAKLQRKQELEAEKQKLKETKLALEKAKKEELSQHKSILTSKQQEEESKKQELLAQKQSEEERILDEELKAKKQRDLELQKAQEERDLKLAPILEKLKIETDKLNILNEEKQAIQDITNSQIKNTENAENLLKTSQQELQDSITKLEQLKIDIKESTTEQEKLTKEAEFKKIEAEVALKKTNELQAESILKQAEFDKERAVLENEKLNLELELENAKIEVLQEEKEIAEILPPTTTAAGTKDVGVESKDVEESKDVKTTGGVDTTAAGATVGTKLPKTIVTGHGTVDLSSKFDQNNLSTRSIQDKSGILTPIEKQTNTSSNVPTSADEVKASTSEKPELKKTFSGFSQGSNYDEEKGIDTTNTGGTNTATGTNASESTPDVELSNKEKDEKHKSFFKEEF